MTQLSRHPEGESMIAKCTSQKCEGRNSFKGIVKEVKLGTINCPDCGSVLRWHRAGINQKYIASSGYKLWCKDIKKIRETYEGK